MTHNLHLTSTRSRLGDQGRKALFGAAATAALTMACVSPAGAVTAVSNGQPTLAVNESILNRGIFPSQGAGSAVGDVIGFVSTYAGNFTPSGGISAQGQSLSITNEGVLFDVVGTTYGGDGTTTFSVPNLNNTVMIGSGAGPGLTPRVEGAHTGAATVTLTNAQLPAPIGGGQAFDNMQPSLPIETLIATRGVFPSSGGPNGTATFIGEIAEFAGTFVPSGWALADGSVFTVAAEPALASVIGDAFGGNGSSTFALPDLRGRVAVGADAAHPLGTAFGEESTVLTLGQLPPGSAPVNNDEPSLAINYLIANRGVFPVSGGSSGGYDATAPTVCSIVGFAGNFVPSGYLAADGQLLLIADEPILFDLLGTAYGGDGVTTFALPNLEGRALVGADGITSHIGDAVGADQFILTQENLPRGVPEPATWAMMLLGFTGLGAMTRGRRMARFAAPSRR